MVGAFNSWRNQNSAEGRALMNDFEIWGEYVELLTIADEISKERADIDIENIKNSLKMRLRVAHTRAKRSKRESAIVIRLFGEIESPIWDHHIPLLQRAITCLETGDPFDKRSEGDKLYKQVEERNR